MIGRIFVCLLITALLLTASFAEAQQAKTIRFAARFSSGKVMAKLKHSAAFSAT